MRYAITLRAMTPICHGDTITGIDNATNTRLFMRQNMMVGNVQARVPAISENALRSTMFRGPLADHLVDKLDLQPGDLPQTAVNLLYSGGQMRAGSKAPGNDIELGHQIRALYPSLDLLGGAVDGFILPRSRLNVACWLVAREYAEILDLVAPELADEAREVSAFDLLAEETRTRGTGSESGDNQMLYTYETLAAGAKIHIELSLDPATPEATLGAINTAIAYWDHYIGGQARQGRGRVEIIHSTLEDHDAAYDDHIAGHADAMREGLTTGTLGTGTVLCAG